MLDFWENDGTRHYDVVMLRGECACGWNGSSSFIKDDENSHDIASRSLRVNHNHMKPDCQKVPYVYIVETGEKGN